MPKMKQVLPGCKKSTKNVSNWNKNDEALLAAVTENDPRKVEQLLAKKVLPTKIDHQGHTTFHRTAKAGKIECVKLFLKYRIDPACIDLQERTPLHEACKYDRADVAKLLVHNYEDRTAGCTEDTFGMTPLHHACMGASQRCVYLLLQKDYPPNLADTEGRTALHYASTVPICKLLVDREADLNACDKLNKTALILAAEYGNVEVARYLINQGANTRVQDSRGHNAKWYCTSKRPNPEIQALLENAPIKANWTVDNEASPDDMASGGDGVYSELGEDMQISIDIRTQDAQENGVGISQVEVGIVPMDDYGAEGHQLYDHIGHDDDDESLHTAKNSIRSSVRSDKISPRSSGKSSVRSSSRSDLTYKSQQEEGLPNAVYDEVPTQNHVDEAEDPYSNGKIGKEHIVVHEVVHNTPAQLQQGAPPPGSLTSSHSDPSSYSPQEEAYRELIEEHESLQKELEAVNRENRSLKAQIEDMSNQDIYNDGMSLPATRQNAVQEQMVEHLETNLKETETRLEEEMERTAELVNEIKCLRQEINDNDEQIVMSPSKHPDTSWNDDGELFNNSQAREDHEVAALAAKLMLLNQENVQLRKEIERYENELHVPLQQRSPSEQELGSLAQYQELQQAHESEVSDLNVQIRELKRLNEDLYNSDAAAEVNSLKAQMQKTEAELEVSLMERHVEREESATEMGRLREALEEQVRQLQQRAEKEERDSIQSNTPKVITAASLKRSRSRDKADEELTPEEMRQELVIIREDNVRLQKKNAADEESLLQEMLDDIQANHEEQMTKMEEELQQVKQENDQLTRQLSDKPSEGETMPREEYEELRKTHVQQVGEYINQMEKLEREKEDLQLQLQKPTADNDDKEEIAELQTKVIVLKGQVDDLSSPTRQRQLADAAYGDLQDAHRAQVVLLADRVADLETEKDELKRQLEEAPESNSEVVRLEVSHSLQASHDKDLEDLMDQHRVDRARSDQEVEDLRKQLEDQREKSDAHSDDLRRQLDDQSSKSAQEVEDLREQLHHLHQQHSTEMGGLNAVILKLNAEKGDGEKDWADKVKAQEEVIHTMESTHQAEADKLRFEISSLEKDRDEQQHDMGKLTHALTLGAADKEQMQENVEDLQDQNRELAKELSKSGRKTRKDSDSDDENEKLKERIAMLEAERKDLGKKLLSISREDALSKAQMRSEHAEETSKLQQELEDLKTQKLEMPNKVVVEEPIEVQTSILVSSSAPTAPPRRRSTKGKGVSDEEVQELEKKVEQLEKDNGDLDGKLTSLTNAQSYTEQELAELNFQLETLGGKGCPEELQGEIEQLQQNVRQLQIKLQCPTDWPAEVSRECERLRSENHQMRRHVGMLDEEQEQEREEREQLEAQLEELGARIEEADRANEEAVGNTNKEKDALQSELVQTKLKLKLLEEVRDKEKTEDVKDLECRNLQLQAEVDQLQGEFNRTNVHLQQLQDVADASKSLDTDNTNLLQEIEISRNDLVQSKLKQKILEDNIEKLCDDLKESEAKAQDYRLEAEEAQLEAKHACDAADQADKEAQKSREEAETSHADAEEMRALSEKIQKDSEQICSEADQSNKQMGILLGQLQQDNNDLLSENRTLKADLTDIEDKLQKRLQALQETDEEENNNVDRAEYDRLRDENKRLSNELEEVSDDMEHLKTKEVKASRRAADATSDLERLRDDSTCLAEDVKELNKQLKAANADKHELDTELILAKKLASNTNTMRLDNERLKNEVRDLKAHLDSQADLITSIKGDELVQVGSNTEYKRLHDELDSAGEKSEDMEKKVEQLEKENKQLHNDFEQLAKILEDRDLLEAGVSYGDMSTTDFCTMVRDKVQELKEADQGDRVRLARENSQLMQELAQLQSVLEGTTKRQEEMSNREDKARVAVTSELTRMKAKENELQRQVLLQRKREEDNDRKLRKLQDEKADLAQKLQEKNSYYEADDYKSLQRQCSQLRQESDEHRDECDKLRGENKRMRDKQENDAFEEIEQIRVEAIRSPTPTNAVVVEKVAMFEGQLIQPGLSTNPEKLQEELGEMQHMVNKLVKEMEERNEHHKHVVGTYRSHLLAAMQGRMDPDVRQALGHIMKLRRTSSMGSNSSTTA